METVKYSVVIPFKDEEGNIKALFDELEPVMNGLGVPWELICVDDGSTDGTKRILQELHSQNSAVRLLFLKRNYGQSSAFDAGFKAAKGEFIITLDGDGQNDPADIPRLILMMDQLDLVCGIRAKRKDRWDKRLVSKMANVVRQACCNDGMKDTGCSLKIYRRSCFNKIKMYHGMHRFLPALFKIEGFRIGQVPVNHRERLRGKSKYNYFNRSFNTLADMLAVRWMNQRQLRYEVDRRD